MKCLQHMSVAESAIYFWLNCLPAGAMLVHEDYIGVQEVPNALPGFTNVVSSARQFSDAKPVYRKGWTENSLSHMAHFSKRVWH